MANFNSEFKKILKELEEGISDKNALEIAKVEMLKLYNLFFDEITNLEQTMNDRMVEIAQTQVEIEEKLKSMNKSIKNIEKDIYMEDDMDNEDFDIEIKCPYCNETFMVEMDELTSSEITCPECNNTIELDWGAGCDCGDDGCDNCSSNGHSCHHEDEDDDM